MTTKGIVAFFLAALLVSACSLSGCAQNQNQQGQNQQGSQSSNAQNSDTKQKGQGGSNMAGGSQKISAEEAKQMMDAGGVTVVDVRTEGEYAGGHVEGAINLPVETITSDETAVSATLPNKDATILVYCRSGARSSNAARALANMGYTNIYDFGGVTSWPYDLVQ